MHKFSAIFIVFLFSLNLILSMKLFTVDYKSTLKQTQNQLTQLLLQVESSESSLSLEEIENHILKILNDVQESQERHIAISKRMHIQCNDETNFRRTEIKDANSAFKASADALAKCQISLDQANFYLPKLEESKRYFEDLLSQKLSERNKNHGNFYAVQKEWNNAILFIEDFIRQIKSKGGKSFTGFSQLTQNLITHMTKVGKLNDLAPIFVEITNKADNGLQKLLNLVTDLKVRLTTDLKIFEDQEKKQDQMFESVKNNLLALIKQLTSNIQRTNSQIISMRLCVTKEASIMNSASSKSSRNAKLFKLAQRTCQDFAREFITATKIRKSELVTIRQILGVIRRRFGQIDPAIRKRLNVISTSIKLYINGNEFKAYKEYVKTKISDNSKGRALSQ